MELKDFQKTSLERIKKYLELVRKEQDKGNARNHAFAVRERNETIVFQSY